MMRTLIPFEAFPTHSFRDPDTGHAFGPFKELKDLYVAIIQYRAQNNLEPLEYLRETVENYLCSLPENANRCKSIELHRSAWTYVKGGIQLFKNMWFKRTVSQAVADTRAAQCAKCPYNVFPDKGPFMNFVDEVAVAQVGDKIPAHAAELGNCSVCSCVLRSKVFFDGKLDKFPDDQLVQLRRVNCWQLPLAGQ